MRLVDGDVVLLLHAIHELLDQLVELLGGHGLDLLAHVLVEHVAVQQRFGNGVAQVVERLLLRILVVIVHVLPLKSALQQVVGERREQVFHAHLAGGVGNVFLVLDEFHKRALSTWPLALSH